jgi:hypothetical protein
MAERTSRQVRSPSVVHKDVSGLTWTSSGRPQAGSFLYNQRAFCGSASRPGRHRTSRPQNVDRAQAAPFVLPPGRTASRSVLRLNSRINHLLAFRPRSEQAVDARRRMRLHFADSLYTPCLLRPKRSKRSSPSRPSPLHFARTASAWPSGLLRAVRSQSVVHSASAWPGGRLTKYVRRPLSTKKFPAFARTAYRPAADR